MARKQMVSPPQEGSEAPEFVLPAAQGGQFRLGLRTARGPVIVVFYRGAWSEECVEYFKALAEKEREINVAGATLAGVGVVEPDEAREFVRATGFKSYVLYDYLRETSRGYGLLQKDAEHGDTARPAVFLIGSDYTVLRAWLDERPAPDDLLAEVSRVTGLPKEPEEEEGEEKPKRRPRKTAEGEASAGTEDAQKPAAEEGRKERAGKSAAPEAPEKSTNGEKAGGSDAASDGSESKEKQEAGDEATAEAGESPEGTAPEPESGEARSSEGSGGEGETGGETSTSDAER